MGFGSGRYRTVEVTAKDKKDFIASEGVIEFDEDRGTNGFA